MNLIKIGSGNTADIYRYDDKNIIKVFHSWNDEHGIQNEYECLKAVQGLGIKVPAIGKRVEIDGKQAIVMEYINGKSMLTEILSPNTDIVKLANDFAKLHFNIHQCKDVSLESGKRNLAKKIKWSDELETQTIEKILNLLDTLPEGNSLCHNDFHPDNVIINEKGLYTIDWCDTSCGNPLADVARTSLVFDCISLPDSISKQMADQINKARRYFGFLYEKAYAKLIGEDTLSIKPWKVVVAASRMFCENEENKPIFKRMIYEYFKQK